MASYDLKAIFGEKLKRLTDKTLKALVDCMCTVGASLCSLDKRVSALESVKMPEGGYKPMQEPVASPTASGTAMQFIESVSQDATGRMTAIKKTVQDGTTSQKGVVQLEDSYTSTSTSKAATPNAVNKAYSLAEGKQDAISDLSTIRSGATAGATAIQSVKVNGTALTPDSNKAVNIPLASSSANGAMSKTDKSKLDGIASGAQVNVIESVKVNGTAQTVTSKAVDIAVPTASTTSPKMDGTASAGSETKWAKGDHRHPTDTSREAASNKKTTLDATSDTDFPTSKAVGAYVGTAIEPKLGRFHAYLLRSSSKNPNYWFTLASITITGSTRDISGAWDVYLKMRGRYYTSSEYTILAGTLLLEIYGGSNSSSTDAPLRKLKFITDCNCPLEFVIRRTGTLSTGSVKVEIMAGNLGTLATNGSSIDAVGLFLVERARSYFSGADTWDYVTYATSDTRGEESKPTGHTPATPSAEDPVVEVYSTNDSSRHKTYIYDADVKSTYIPTGTGSDAPVNGLALADALAGGTASAATATALKMGQLGNAGRPVYIGSDGKPKLCDADIAVFIAEYIPNGTSTPFASILLAYNSGRAIILKTSFCYVMLNGVSLSSGGDITSFVFEGFTGNYIQDFSVNSNNVWAYHAIPLTLSSQGAPNGALGSQSNPLSLVYSTSFVGDVTGKADSADKINTDAGSNTVPVYVKNGIPKASNCRFIYSVDASGNYSTVQYKLCVGSIGTTPNTFYFT